jgi:protein O-mannosyl-transferase
MWAKPPNSPGAVEMRLSPTFVAVTQRVLALAFIAAAAGVLYLPYVGNELVFDDSNIFHTTVLRTAAVEPWQLGIRGLPYFTLGWVQTQIGTLEAHRLISLALHIVVAYQLFRLLEALLSPQDPSGQHQPIAGRARAIALVIALAFACHPVAVYGAAYLVQRTIVLATLFFVLCLRDLLQALRRNDRALAARAALWASLAILCKEHAVVVPMAALALVVVAGRPWRPTLATSGMFLGLSVPAMALALHGGLYAIGQGYEPGLINIETELYGLPQLSGRYEKWLLSASSQAQLYFHYWLQWLWPDPSRMSVDLRIDFRQPWTHAGAWLRIAGFAALPLAAVLLSLRAPKARVIAVSLVLTAFLFIVELGTVRFQEPYVLYRSYLWSVGYGIFVAGLLYRLPGYLGVGLLALAIPLLAYQATGRLETFRTKFALWEDAAAKLPKLEVAGASRILFNRGRERFGAGDVDRGMQDIDQAIRLSPVNGRYRIARAVVLLRQGKPREALDDLSIGEHALPDDGHLLFVRFAALRAMGRTVEADAALLAAARNGNYAARFELGKRSSRGGEVIVELNSPP